MKNLFRSRGIVESIQLRNLRFDLRLDDPSRRRRSSNRSNLSNHHSSGRKRARLTNAIIVHSPLDRGFGETITSGSVGKREREREKVKEGERASKLFPKSEVSGFEHDRLDTRSLSLPYASPLIWRLVSVGSVTKLDIN